MYHFGWFGGAWRAAWFLLVVFLGRSKSVREVTVVLFVVMGDVLADGMCLVMFKQLA